MLKQNLELVDSLLVDFDGCFLVVFFFWFFFGGEAVIL